MYAWTTAQLTHLCPSTYIQDPAPVLSPSPPSPSPPLPADKLSISVEELRNLNEAVSTLKGERQLEDEIQELKEEREEYREVSQWVSLSSLIT